MVAVESRRTGQRGLHMPIVNDTIVYMLSVEEAAVRLGVSPMRVRQLLSNGALAGRKSGRIWLVEESSVSRRQRRDHEQYRRPLGTRMFSALLDALNGLPSDPSASGTLSPAEAGRLMKYLQLLRTNSKPAQVLRDWAGPHEQMRPLRYLGDVTDLLADSRVMPTGFSHPLSDLVASGQLDLRCAASDVPGLISDHLLIEDSEPNVFLHSSTACRPDSGLGTSLIDLASHAGSREDEEVRRLLSGAFGD